MKTNFFIVHCLLLISLLEIHHSAANEGKQLSGPALEKIEQVIQNMARRRLSADNLDTEDSKGAEFGAQRFRCYSFSSINAGDVDLVPVRYPNFCGVIKLSLTEISSGQTAKIKIHTAGNEQFLGPRNRVVGKCTTNPTPLLKKVLEDEAAKNGIRIDQIEVCGCDSDLCNGQNFP